jgi:hypothetical protein
MKQKISLVAALLFAVIFSVNAINPSNKSIIATNPTSVNFSNFEKSTTINGKSLTDITPNDIQKLTGKKLSLKEVIKLKAAQKLLKAKAKHAALATKFNIDGKFEEQQGTITIVFSFE